MKQMVRVLAVCLAGWHAGGLQAQEKAKTEEKVREEKVREEKADAKREITSLRLQVVITEYEGEKRISSLPYVFIINSETPFKRRVGALRMGLRVPVATSAGEAKQFQYMDVGTNMDAWAEKVEDGRFLLAMTVERSSAYSPSAGHTAGNLGGNEVSTSQPVIQQFKAQLDLLMRDGQTVQSTVATDPVSGRVTKVEVTASVMK